MPRYAKKKYKRRSRSTQVTIKKAVEKALKKVVEIKTTEDAHTASHPIVGTPIRISDYFDISEGNDSDQRIGQQLYMKTIRLRTTLKATEETYRILYIWMKDDKMNDQLVAAFNNLEYNSFLPRNLGQSYRVLADNTYNIDEDSSDVRDIKKTFKINSKLVYTPNASTIRQGQLNCFIYVRRATSNTSTDTFSHVDSFRTYYTDQ